MKDVACGTCAHLGKRGSGQKNVEEDKGGQLEEQLLSFYVKDEV
jgi:hypothetical protein